MELIVFWGFNLYAWITIATVLTMFTVLLFTKLRADLVFLGAISILFVTGVLNAKEAFSGFSSTSVVIIGVLFVVVAGLTHTGVLQWIVKHLLGQPKTYSKAVIRLMLPVAALSSFLSNTTVVALFVGIVKMWSKKLNISPSQLLIPLSYASGMGGVCTLIGTPPNLIISGLYADHTGNAMNVLATTIPGLFCLFIGVLSIIAMRKLLPDRKAPEAAFESTSDYTIELLVPSDNPHIGETIAEAGLNDVRGGSLIEIIHYDDITSPVPDDDLIMGGDRLIFAGQIDEILDLKKSHGLVNADHHVFTMSEVDQNRQLRTAYVTFGSSLINKSIGGSSFEKDNNLTLVAVARRGKRIEESPRDVVLQAGRYLYHRVYLQHGSRCHVLPHHVRGRRETGLRALSVPHCPDGQRQFELRHTNWLTYPHAGLWSWRLPLQRLHAHWSADELHHPGCQYPYREYYLSFNPAKPITS